MCIGSKPLAVLVYLVSIALAAPGCGTMKAYPGDDLPSNQTAFIQPDLWAGIFQPLVLILSVDAQVFTGGLDYRIAVEPGPHSIAVALASGGPYFIRPATPHTLLLFEAEAGHSYVVSGERTPGGPAYRIVDSESREVVASHRPD